MPISDEQVGKATRELLSSTFYDAVLRPWLLERKQDLIEDTDKLIREDAPKNKFSVVSGKRQMLSEIEEQLILWSKRDQVNRR